MNLCMYMRDTKIGNGKEKICYSRTSKIVEKIFFWRKKTWGVCYLPKCRTVP